MLHINFLRFLSICLYVCLTVFTTACTKEDNTLTNNNYDESALPTFGKITSISSDAVAPYGNYEKNYISIESNSCILTINGTGFGEYTEYAKVNLNNFHDYKINKILRWTDTQIAIRVSCLTTAQPEEEDMHIRNGRVYANMHLKVVPFIYRQQYGSANWWSFKRRIETDKSVEKMYNGNYTGGVTCNYIPQNNDVWVWFNSDFDKHQAFVEAVNITDTIEKDNATTRTYTITLSEYLQFQWRKYTTTVVIKTDKYGKKSIIAGKFRSARAEEAHYYYR
jgi:hypothetical protein